MATVFSFGSIGPVTTTIFRSVIAKYRTNASKSFQIPRLMAALCGLMLLMKKLSAIFCPEKAMSAAGARCLRS